MTVTSVQLESKVPLLNPGVCCIYPLPWEVKSFSGQYYFLELAFSTMGTITGYTMHKYERIIADMVCVL